MRTAARLVVSRTFGPGKRTPALRTPSRPFTIRPMAKDWKAESKSKLSDFEYGVSETHISAVNDPAGSLGQRHRTGLDW